MDLFRDKRPSEHLPTEEDFQRQLDKAGLTEANRRFRSSGVRRKIHSDPEAANAAIKQAAKARRKGQEFESVGEYLEFLNGIST